MVTVGLPLFIAPRHPAPTPLLAPIHFVIPRLRVLRKLLAGSNHQPLVDIPLLGG
jgi:hypothetical protein